VVLNCVVERERGREIDRKKERDDTCVVYIININQQTQMQNRNRKK
jgi:hypothetical protein